MSPFDGMTYHSTPALLQTNLNAMKPPQVTTNIYSKYFAVKAAVRVQRMCLQNHNKFDSEI